MTSEVMTPNRPYLVRALYDWITDNHLTPHILVDTEAEGVDVPSEAIQKGKIILNIDPQAVDGLDLGNEWIQFAARFSGKSRHIQVPINAVVAIYARENGQGMMFSGDDGTPPPPDSDGDDDGESAKARAPHLSVVK